MANEPGYWVVFEGVGVEAGGNYEGIRTRTCYDSEDEFNKRRGASTKDVIVAQGVSDEESLRLVQQTSGRARANAFLRQV